MIFYRILFVADELGKYMLHIVIIAFYIVIIIVIFILLLFMKTQWIDWVITSKKST